MVVTILGKSALARGASIVSALLALSAVAHANGPRKPEPKAWHEPARRAPQPARTCDPDRDRRAILGMTGTFEVSFSFEEVEALAPGHVLRPPYKASGIEVVKAIEKQRDQVVLQHVLLIETAPGEYFPLKHWRQDWIFEDRELLEFLGKGVWQHRRLSRREAECTWSQAVSQVDDGPRYESYGVWEHHRRDSSWTSHPTNRPLPRRELTQRSDYDVLLAVNTHRVHARGWDHIEDNLKWAIDSNTLLAREAGLNEYQRIRFPAEQIALDYLKLTGDVWEDVRDVWQQLIDAHDRVHVADTIDGVAPYDVLFAAAEDLAKVDPVARRAWIEDLLAPYVSAAEGSGTPTPPRAPTPRY
jgi:hypothetical protein